MKKEFKYCVTLYDNLEENLIVTQEYETKLDAMINAIEYEKHKSPSQYIEVWEKDSEGLYGNCGSPIYKSDFNNKDYTIVHNLSREKIKHLESQNIFKIYPELDEIVNDLCPTIIADIEYKVKRVESEMPYKFQYILENLIHTLGDSV